MHNQESIRTWMHSGMHMQGVQRPCQSQHREPGCTVVPIQGAGDRQGSVVEQNMWDFGIFEDCSKWVQRGCAFMMCREAGGEDALRGWGMGIPLLLMLRKKRNDRAPEKGCSNMVQARSRGSWFLSLCPLYEALRCPGRCLHVWVCLYGVPVKA